MSNNEVLAMYRAMLVIRETERSILELSQQADPAVAGSVHLCAGQEAVPVGALAALRDDDLVVATYRGHGWALASGLTLTEVIGEVCHRLVGINGGRGGSAYFMAPHRRFIGENSIVGAGVPIGCGVAMASVAQENGRVTIVSLGDGAFNQGATHEGLAFAAARNLPLIVLCENNGWSEMTATDEIFRTKRIAQRAGGYGITGSTIDGTNPVIVRDTIRLAAEAAREGKGPFLIECTVPRLWGHYNRDIEHYRSKADKAEAAARDPIPLTFARLAQDGLLTEADNARLQAEVASEVAAAVAATLASPRPDPATASEHVWAPAHLPVPSEDQAAPAQEMTYIQAVNAALDRELAKPETLVYGEDCGRAGGIFGATRNLQRNHGEDRVFDTPIAESAILGSAVGSALMGMRPIVEIMWADFMLVALDQLINQAANIRYVSGGMASAPIVVRTQQGATPGSCAQHSQSLEALLAHIPGLRIATPATPQDAYDVLRAAAASDDPCIVIEARALYQTKGEVHLHDTAGPIGRANLRRSGRDGLVICWGTMVAQAQEAARKLHEEDSLDIAILDLVWLSPLDEAALRLAVAETDGPIVIAHEANRTGGFGAEIAVRVQATLSPGDARPVHRVATPDVRMPASPVLQKALLPNADTIVAALRRRAVQLA